ncbi:alpha/beta hydrolase [Blastococcus haudaquaticus]|uniref:Uncharacterized protein n=1 Tax=Blastococcus haudaquaticus TaxID=1938745 RepID=A0A286H6N7_9ACTN|nr:alpha/beta hydrolase [Blastococcus haudaquaticus]SOE03455.1 hypothetical protein SAMN06272739_4180 [Blastococcus haudaquaticus]
MTTSTLKPFRTVGHDNPFWLLQYDKRGASRSPETLDEARRAVRSADFTDVVVFSHGWNNDWDAATTRYDEFVDGLVGQLPDDPDRRVLLLGIFWPSALLVMPGERAPVMAAAVGDDPYTEALDAVTDELDPADADRVRTLSAKSQLDDDESTELAQLLAPVYRAEGPELGDEAEPPAPEELTKVWRSGPPPGAARASSSTWGTVDDRRNGVQAAGLLQYLDPRNAIRGASVWLMKDRAGRVGSAAVGPLVREALAESEARVHLVGHSFGGKVVLSALCAEPVARPVHSVLLLQPAVNHLCFASAGPDGPAGGYRTALERTVRPVFSTYSRHDAPLTKFFHWALRRDSDLREPMPAGWPEPPSRFAALGGFGPHGADDDTARIELRSVGDPYVFPDGRRLVGVDSSASIRSHGGISVPETWWAMRELMRP